MKKEIWYRGLFPLLAAVICLLCSATTIFSSLNQWAADQLYTIPRARNNNIKIIMIDKKSEAEYGNFSDWSRQRAADLVNALNVPGAEPLVIGFDINYVTDREQNGDDAFAAAAKKAGNVITASTVMFEDKVVAAKNGELVGDDLYIAGMEFPYSKLREVSRYGFSDALQDKDGNVRMSLLSVEQNGETVYNFSYEIYRYYCEKTGTACYVPNTNLSKNNKIFGIRYVDEPGSYETYSWADVVNGVYQPEVFQDSIVLVGAYTSGMLDQYPVPIAKNSQMFGVEIHANIVDAMLRGQSYQIAPKTISMILTVVICLLYLIILLKAKLRTVILSGAGLIVVTVISAVITFKKGYCFYPATTVLTLIVMLVVFIGLKYVLERLSKRKLLKEFKKYVAKQVLDQMFQNGELKIQLGGESKDIAVLFVDIRGFTTLSESLEPEQIVGMLNEYLALTTECIFKNGGTLDKFIGDATMAIFNAPVDLPDYEMKAVRTAIDIVQGAAKVNVKIKEKIGRKVSFGVGVNCGKAVVGNTGCETRMDYTAIGDTVNTAARLEGKALGGQVVISQMMKDRLGDRLITEPLGKMSLKGKAEPLPVYAVLGIANEESTQIASKAQLQ